MKYYKFRNANSSFEHDVLEKLNLIVKSQEGQNESLICGVFSAIISNYFTVKMKDAVNYNLVFVILLVVIYAFFLTFYRLGKMLIKYIFEFKNRDSISDKEGREKREIFFSKIINEVVMGVSLVNRIELLKVKKMKSELWYIYATQALYCFQRTAEYLDDIVFRKTQKYTKKSIECIGEDSIKWVLEITIEYLDRIKALYNEIDIDIAKDYYQRKLGELKHTNTNGR